MSIVYTCRHCSHELGRIDQQTVDTTMLGFDQLSVEEKKEMIQYAENGDVIVRTICENCEETLQRYPEYHELDHFIQ